MTLTGNSRTVVVVGGGLAGISAAIGLADAGLDVTLLEARAWLGGATCSFARRGLMIDNGQHVFMRCCETYRGLLARLGVTAASPLQGPLDVTVLGLAAASRVHGSRLPAPMHLVRSIARYRLLSASERAKAAAAAVALQFADADRHDRSLGDWLARHGQDERSRRAFWDVLTLSALNVPADHAELPLAAAAISTALLAGRGNADLGIPLVPLSQLHGNPAAELLRQLGVTVRLGVGASALRVSPAGGYDVRLVHTAPPGASGVLAPEREAVYDHAPTEINAAGIVLAVPAWDAAALVQTELADVAATWSSLRPSPVVSLHVIYGTRVTELPFAAVVDSPVHWVVDKTEAAGLRTGQYLAASIRAADAYVDTPVSELRAELMPELERLFPSAAGAIVTDFFVTRERRATIAHVPASTQSRVTTGAELPGFAVAGAWTDTGWPDTMEGAVRSGRSAARKIIAELPAIGAMAAGRLRPPAARVNAEGAATPGPMQPGPDGRRHVTSTS
ncbi:MAG TPA: hydroxysqualene dehydroxylase HpnE [Streptosporangiaceae bacterium]|nr:hydroxysqualene dehydroxylase HpnE [Streptosporangiaceae bacterium]